MMSGGEFCGRHLLHRCFFQASVITAGLCAWVVLSDCTWFSWVSSLSWGRVSLTRELTFAFDASVPGIFSEWIP